MTNDDAFKSYIRHLESKKMTHETEIALNPYVERVYQGKVV
jgi:hypothetical protein